VSCGGCHTIVWALPRRKSLTNNEINDVFTSTLIENNSQPLSRAVLPPIQKPPLSPSVDSPKTTSTDNPPTSESQSNKSMDGVTISPGALEESPTDHAATSSVGDVEQLTESIQELTTQPTANESSDDPPVSVSKHENNNCMGCSMSRPALSSPIKTLHNVYYPGDTQEKKSPSRVEEKNLNSIKAGLTQSLHNLSDLSSKLKQCNDILQNDIHNFESDTDDIYFNEADFLVKNCRDQENRCFFNPKQFTPSREYRLQQAHDDHIKAFNQLQRMNSHLYNSCKCKGDHHCMNDLFAPKYSMCPNLSETAMFMRDKKKATSPASSRGKGLDRLHSYSHHDRLQHVCCCTNAPHKRHSSRATYEQRLSESKARNRKGKNMSCCSDYSDDLSDITEREEEVVGSVRPMPKPPIGSGDNVPKPVEENGVDLLAKGSEGRLSRFFKKKCKAPQPTQQKSVTSSQEVEDEVVVGDSAKDLHKKSKMCVIL